MKKVIIFLFVITLCLCISNKEEQIIIPKESIRFRIIANSNSVKDQLLKMEIKKELLPIFNTFSEDNISSMRESIKNSLPLIEEKISNYTSNYTINFGTNYFPEKTYQNLIYNEGEYESLVISLGNAVGDNWWCVLFPPLCLLEAEKDNLDDITYKSYIKTIINKHF
ncbi:MAG: stage II sporulation protein R [Bacilli bacterium]|nr:stage II sporulation protein R [Bacilli bacterium]